MKPKIIIPETFMGIPIKGAIERALAKEKEKPEVQAPNIILPDSKEMIYVPEVNLYFARQRTHLNEDWYQTHKSLADEGLRMPTMNEFRFYLKHLRDNSSNPDYRSIFNEITEVRDPWRSQWIDAYFEERKTGIIPKEIYALTHNKTKEEKLETCLMQDKIPGISLDSWLNDSTSQGLPKKDINDGSLYFWFPRNGAVARVVTYSDRLSLYCSGGPSDRGPSLGVFAVSGAGS